MTILGKHELDARLATEDLENRLVVTPLLDRAKQVTRGSIDLRLGTELLFLTKTGQSGMDPRSITAEGLEATYERRVIQYGESFWLHPNHFVLAATLEFIALPRDLAAYVVGRSSWGRLGLIVATAVFVHPGYRGCLTLELVNDGDSPISLSPGFRIAQLVVHTLKIAAPETTEDEKYVAPVRPRPALLSRERSEFEQLERTGRALRSRLG